MFKQKQILYVLFSVIFCSLAMTAVDGILQPQYAVKSLIKIVLFLLIPLGYFVFTKQILAQLKALFKPSRKNILTALGLGLGVYTVILGGYFFLKDFIDFSAIAENLTASAGVSAKNFIFVSIYISFINSLLEEFFFRGFAFITLKNIYSERFAYIFSAAFFAIYHIGMTSGWFNIGIFVLALIGLFVGGCIFNYLNSKSGNIYISWIVHMFANFAINTVGFIMFGII